MKREIEVWKRATNSISGYSRDENSVRNVLNRKVEILETILQDHCYETVPPEDNYHSVLNELEAKVSLIGIIYSYQLNLLIFYLNIVQDS